MRKLLGFLGFFAFTSVLAISADAAPGQNLRGWAGADTSRATAISSSRMPTMPAGMGGVVSAGIGGGNMSPSQNLPNPTVMACIPGATQACVTTTGQSGTQVCEENGTWGQCIATVTPPKVFSVEECMNSLMACVNSGGLPNGVADMYDQSIRNSIISGMGLCKSVVDRCIADINFYHSSSDVWIDFNSRVVQPEYYSFVLRKTELTPNQAENTCNLLDKNVYGKSFAAVGGTKNNKQVRGEYDQDINAYNNLAKEAKTKDNPLGATVNNDANYDGGRGHYARWDATKGECLVRVAAYNKDKLITNKWLGIGDDKAAEVWQPAGSSFTCNKELFEFGLMNQTKKMAVLGTTGGAVAGGLLGLAGGAVKDKKLASMDYCDSRENLIKMNEELKDNEARAILNEYLGGPSATATYAYQSDQPLAVTTVLKSGKQITKKECEKIQKLYNSYQQWKVITITAGTDHKELPALVEYCPNCNTNCDNVIKKGQEIYTEIYDNTHGAVPYCALLTSAKTAMEETDTNICTDLITAFGKFMDSIGCDNEEIQDCTNQELANGKRLYHNPNRMYANLNKEVYCNAGEQNCISGNEFKKQVARLGSVLENLDIANTIDQGMSHKAKGALIGAGVGAGVGGLATAITAFVEKNNISCRVGDDLNRIQMGKSGTIDTLKNYYVKWGLNLPDIVTTPTVHVTDCDSWRAACSAITNIEECVTASVHYKKTIESVTTTQLVHNACAVNVADGTCQENLPVATSQGACP